MGQYIPVHSSFAPLANQNIHPEIEASLPNSTISGRCQTGVSRLLLKKDANAMSDCNSTGGVPITVRWICEVVNLEF